MVAVTLSCGPKGPRVTVLGGEAHPGCEETQVPRAPSYPAFALLLTAFPKENTCSSRERGPKPGLFACVQEAIRTQRVLSRV